MIGAVDQGHVGALMLLDLSATFDTVDHKVLIEVLQRRFGDVSGKALDWLGDYLSGRCKVVRAGGSDSENSALHLAFHKDQSLAQRHFLYTLKTSHISWTSKACSITCSLMTCRAKSTEGQLMSQQSSQL